jgi:hypothetical protein
VKTPNTTSCLSSVNTEALKTGLPSLTDLQTLIKCSFLSFLCGAERFGLPMMLAKKK